MHIYVNIIYFENMCFFFFTIIKISLKLFCILFSYYSWNSFYLVLFHYILFYVLRIYLIYLLIKWNILSLIVNRLIRLDRLIRTLFIVSLICNRQNKSSHQSDEDSETIFIFFPLFFFFIYFGFTLASNAIDIIEHHMKRHTQLVGKT